MSKTTKIIAALGVVAGLGVAALPAFTFAEGEPSVDGDVQLVVEVESAIAMTITGNNDDHSQYGAKTYSAVAPAAGTSLTGYYTRSGEEGSYVYTPATGEADGTTIYYQLDSHAVDVFDPAGAASSIIDGHVTPAEQHIGPSSSYLSLLPNSNGTMTSTVTVYTNNSTGYKLTVADKDDDTSIKQDATNYIPASATPTSGEHAGGWSIAGGSLNASAIVASDATPLVVKTTDAKTSGGDPTTMTYTVATAADQATGIYTDVITYTATCNE